MHASLACLVASVAQHSDRPGALTPHEPLANLQTKPLHLLHLLDKDGLQWSAQHLRSRLAGVVSAGYTFTLGYDPSFSRTLLSLVGPRGRRPAGSVLDVGCGICLYAYDLAHATSGPVRSGLPGAGVPRVTGLEPYLPADIHPQGVPILTNVDVLMNGSLPETFDAVLNFEVAEHIPRESHQQWFDWLVARE